MAHILDRMRRAQQRHRQEGSYIALPALDERVFEQRLRVGDGVEVARDVDRALRFLAQWWSASGRRVPVVTGVTVDPESIAVVVDHVDLVEPPRRVTIGENGQSLLVDRVGLSELPEAARRPRTDSSAEGSGDRRMPTPTLVTAGRNESGIVMIDLEALGSIVVKGAPDAREGFLRALALELATSYWSAEFELVLVGFGAELE